MGGCACATLLPSTLFLGERNAAAHRGGAEARPGRQDCAWPISRSPLPRRGARRYADFRLCRYQTEYLEAREHRLEESSTGFSAGFAVRVLLDGTWGYASSPLATEDEVRAATARALDVARASQPLQTRNFVLEDIPVYQRPLGHADEGSIRSSSRPTKRSRSCSRSTKPRSRPAPITPPPPSLSCARKNSSPPAAAAAIEQTRVRSMPDTEVTVIDKATGKFASLRGTGRAARQRLRLHPSATISSARRPAHAAQAREKLHAKPVEPGHYDLVLDPDQPLADDPRIGRPSHGARPRAGLGGELRRHDVLHAGQARQAAVRQRADEHRRRPQQEGGLSTVGYDDDGVRAIGSEFPIIQNGIFVNYQMAIGQAQLIGLKQLQRLRLRRELGRFPDPAHAQCLAPAEPEDVLARRPDRRREARASTSWATAAGASTSSGTTSSSAASFSTRSATASSAGMLRDVAYQGSTVEFWNSMDGTRRQERPISSAARRIAARASRSRPRPSRTARCPRGSGRSTCSTRSERTSHDPERGGCARAVEQNPRPCPRPSRASSRSAAARGRTSASRRTWPRPAARPAASSISVESHFGKRSGSASGHGPDRRRLAALVAASEDVAKRAPENPGVHAAARPADIRGEHRLTPRPHAAPRPTMLAAAIEPVLQPGRGEAAPVVGLSADVGTAFPPSPPARDFSFTTSAPTCSTPSPRARRTAPAPAGPAPRMSISASSTSRAWARSRSTRRSARKSRGALEPGKYTVILEPSAVSDLVGILVAEEFDQRSADEGRSFATKKGGGSLLGEKIFGKNVTVYSDPDRPARARLDLFRRRPARAEARCGSRTAC